MSVIGIDPGKTGAIALVLSENRAEVHDTPTNPQKLSGGREYDIVGMLSLLCDLKEKGGDRAYIEDVHSFRSDGVMGAFSFGRGVGIWHGLLVACSIPFERVRPQTWQKHYSIEDKQVDRKTVSRQVASALFPCLREKLTRVKDHDKAEALLIGRYGYDREVLQS